MRVTYNTEIKASIERVFDCLADDELTRQWMDGLVSTQYLTPRNAENPVGTRFKQRIRKGANVSEYQGVITEYERPILLGVRFKGALFSSEIHYSLEPTQAGTRLTYWADLVWATSILQLTGYLFYPFNLFSAKRNAARQMRRLKAFVEQ